MSPSLAAKLHIGSMSMIIKLRTRLLSPKYHVTPKPRFLSNQNGKSLSTNARFSGESLYGKQISVAKLLQRFGFPSSQLNDFLAKNPSLVDSDLNNMENSLRLLLFDFKIPQKDLASLVLDCPGVLDYSFLKNCESVFSQSGLPSGSPLMIKSLLQHSGRFLLGPGGFSRAIDVLKSLGFSEQTLSRVLEGFPGVTAMEEREIRRRIGFLTEIPIPREGIDRILGALPGVLGFSVEDRLKPLLDEFKALGFDQDLIVEEIVRQPRFLRMEVGELSRCVELLRSLKCHEGIMAKILSEGELGAGFSVKLRVDYFCGLGLIRREAFAILSKEPRAITYKIEDIEKKVDFLVNRMKLSVCCLVDVPEYIGVNLHNLIVPRFNVIEYLRSKDGLRIELNLRDMIKRSRLKFYDLYVKPYPECEKMYPRFASDGIRHPVGMWKMFTPTKYQDTREDVDNMKSFMDSTI